MEARLLAYAGGFGGGGVCLAGLVTGAAGVTMSFAAGCGEAGTSAFGETYPFGVG